jgi:hypothetical protein
VCGAGQVCNPSTRLCEDNLVLSQITPPRALTTETTAVTLSGMNFVPGMTIKWNGTPLQPVSFLSSTQLQVTAPVSADGSWRVSVELAKPDGILVQRSDLFSYYSSAAAFSAVNLSLPGFGGCSAIRAMPLASPTRDDIVYAEGNGALTALTLSSDGSTASKLWSLTVPANVGTLVSGDVSGI